MHPLRFPRQDEIARLRAFLPAPSSARYQLATARAEPSPERIIGAGAWWSAEAAACGGPDRAALCCWRVLPRWQADGHTLLAALLDRLADDAAVDGVRNIYTAAMLPETSSESTLLEARGWLVASRNELFEGALESVGTRLDAAYQRMINTPEGCAAVGKVRPGVLTRDLLPAVHTLVTSKGLVPPG